MNEQITPTSGWRVKCSICWQSGSANDSISWQAGGDNAQTTQAGAA